MNPHNFCSNFTYTNEVQASMPFTSVLLMKLYERLVMHASIWIPVPTYARYKIELKPQRKTQGPARTKEEGGGWGAGRIECDYSLIPVHLPAK